LDLQVWVDLPRFAYRFRGGAQFCTRQVELVFIAFRIDLYVYIEWSVYSSLMGYDTWLIPKSSPLSTP
jgi:hypothetical protein